MQKERLCLNTNRALFMERIRQGFGDDRETLLDWHDFALPKNIADGSYQIYVTLRDVERGISLGQTRISAISVVH